MDHACVSVPVVSSTLRNILSNTQNQTFLAPKPTEKQESVSSGMFVISHPSRPKESSPRKFWELYIRHLLSFTLKPKTQGASPMCNPGHCVRTEFQSLESGCERLLGAVLTEECGAHPSQRYSKTGCLRAHRPLRRDDLRGSDPSSRYGRSLSDTSASTRNVSS